MVTLAQAQTPSMTDIIVPRYVQGATPSNTNRIPCAVRATLQGLKSNVLYRYFNSVVISSDASDANGVGNALFVITDGSSWIRATSPSLSSSGSYGEFTTDAAGSYTGWFVLEPTGNARFIPGNIVYHRINLNDGAGGISIAARLTTTSGSTVLQLAAPPLPTDTLLTPTAVYSISVPEPSGLVFSGTDATLFTVSDGSGGKIYQMSLTGSVLRQLSVNGNDMEGISLSPGSDTIYVAEEELRDIVVYTLAGAKIKSIHVNVDGPLVDNKGLEGVAINTSNRNIYVINQEEPLVLIELTSAGQEIRRKEITYVSSLSDICYDAAEDVLWLVSAKSHRLCKITTDGTLIKWWSIPVVQPEGVTFGTNNTMYICCDAESKLYVFNKP